MRIREVGDETGIQGVRPFTGAGQILQPKMPWCPRIHGWLNVRSFSTQPMKAQKVADRQVSQHMGEIRGQHSLGADP